MNLFIVFPSITVIRFDPPARKLFNDLKHFFSSALRVRTDELVSSVFNQHADAKAPAVQRKAATSPVAAFSKAVCDLTQAERIEGRLVNRCRRSKALRLLVIRERSPRQWPQQPIHFASVVTFVL